jgi:hypothetical protein
MQYTFKRFALTLLTVVVFILPGLGQQVNSLYFMRSVPQIYQINPAFQPECNTFIGLPGVSPIQIKVENSTFGLEDVLMYDGTDSLITFLHPDADKQKFLDLLKDRNYFNTELSTDIASMGFRKGDSYITFDIKERFDAKFSLPGDLFRFPIIGFDSATLYDFNNLSIETNLFMEFSMGLSHKFGDKLTIGWRGKLLFGQASFKTEKFDFTMDNQSDSILIHSNVSFNASVPYLNDYVETGQNLPLEVIFEPFQNEFDNFDFPMGDIPKVVLNPKNFGLAMDVGVDYRATEWLQVSASLIDFGRVKWQSNVFNFSHNENYTFRGIEFDINDENFGDSFLDSLESQFNQFDASETEYVTWLPAKLYVGAAFYPHPKISFGLLSRTQFYDGDISQQFTGSLNLYPIRMLSTTFSYSIIDGYYQNLGLGLALKAGPFNLYMISDTGASSAFWPTKARYVNFKMGMNLFFGCAKTKKAEKVDRPLID